MSDNLDKEIADLEKRLAVARQDWWEWACLAARYDSPANRQRERAARRVRNDLIVQLAGVSRETP